MLKYTPEEHQDYQDLVIAMDKMNGLLAIVNQSSRESRNLEMIMQVEASLTGANVRIFSNSTLFDHHY